MSNSSLVSYTKISPNKTSPRKHKIDTITIHCVVGQLTVEQLGEVFASTKRQASSNYGVGRDGRIGMYVEEKDRSWCSSSSSNDNRAITIEVASDTTHPYAVTDAAYNGLIELLVDICKRNDIKELKWKADKTLIGQVDKQNMTVHRWFANKACPGDYLYNRHGQIADEVNKRLGKKPTFNENVAPSEKVKEGDVVAIEKGATYYDGKDIPDWVENKQWVVDKVSGDRVVINKSTDGKNAINSAIDDEHLTVVKTAAGKDPKPVDKSFKVKISIPNLNIRKGPGTNYTPIGRFTGIGVFTIVDTKTGPGSSAGWGLLKAHEVKRDGWISLDYAKKI